MVMFQNIPKLLISSFRLLKNMNRAARGCWDEQEPLAREKAGGRSGRSRFALLVPRASTESKWGVNGEE